MNDMSEVAGLRRYPLARRGFVMTSLMTGFTLATTVVEAQAIHTDTSGLDAGEVQIPVKDGHLPAYYARPAEGTNFPTSWSTRKSLASTHTSRTSAAASPNSAIWQSLPRSTLASPTSRKRPTYRRSSAR